MVSEDVICDRKYMRTDTNYNSCVYDLEVDFDNLPSNICLPTTNDIEILLKNTLGIAKKGFLKLTTDRIIPIQKTNILSNFVLKLYDVNHINNTNLVNMVNCTISNEGLITTENNSEGTAQTHLIDITNVAKIEYNGSNGLHIEIYNKNGVLINSFIGINFSNLLDYLDTNTGEYYFKFIFSRGDYFYNLNIYKQSNTNIKIKQNKSNINFGSKSNIVSNYLIKINNALINLKNRKNNKKTNDNMYNNEIIGQYQIQIDGKIVLTKTNLITTEGEKFFLQRWLNSRSDYLNDIAIGTGGGVPSKSDTNLNNFKTSTATNNTIDITNKQLILTGTFDAGSSININEIGVRTSIGKLITHDCFEDLTLPEGSTISITYTFKIGTGIIKEDWVKSENYTNVYYSLESETVKSVEETDTQCGYVLKSSINDVNDNPCSFYYHNGNLYIHTSDSNAPNIHTIEIKY